MRLHVFSDVHLEFGEIDIPTVDCDCVVIAGDLFNKHHGLEWIRRRFSTVPVIYICGNHEFYGDKLPRLSQRLRDSARGTNVHVLENDSVTINGVHFFGCTLWTDMALHGNWTRGVEVANNVMNDYKRVRNSAKRFRRLTAADTRLVHLASLDAMRRFFASHDPRTSVVITHHAPSIRSLPEDLHSDPVRCAYVSRLETFIEEHQPQLWIHGHIHRSQDYQIGNTRVLANPRGYRDEPNPRFLPDLVVTVKPAGE